MEDQLNYEDTLAKVRKLSENATTLRSIKPPKLQFLEEDAAPPELPPRLE